MPGLILAMFFIGAALGMRYNVLILIPALGLLVVATLAAASGGDVSACFITAALAFAALQIGYLGGAVMRSYVGLRLLAKAASRRRSSALPS
jgi:hypothetical protein